MTEDELWQTTAEGYEMTDEDVDYILQTLKEDGYLEEEE